MKRLAGYIEDHRRGSTVELVNGKRTGKGYPLRVEVQELVKVGKQIKTAVVQKLEIAPGKQIIARLKPQFRVKAWYEWQPEVYHRRGQKPKKQEIYEGYEEGTFREQAELRHRRPFDGFSSRFFNKQAQLNKEQYYELVIERGAIPQQLWKHSYKLLDKKLQERDRQDAERRKKEKAAEKKREQARLKAEREKEKKEEAKEKKIAAAHAAIIRKAEEYSRKGKFAAGASFAMKEAKKAEARGDYGRGEELWRLSRELQAQVVFTKERGKKVAGARGGRERRRPHVVAR